MGNGVASPVSLFGVNRHLFDCSGNRICGYSVVPGCNRYPLFGLPGHVTFLKLRYSESSQFEPLVNWQESGVDPFTVDYTKEESTFVVVKAIGNGSLTVGIFDGNSMVKAIATDTSVYEGTTLRLAWDRMDGSGADGVRS